MLIKSINLLKIIRGQHTLHGYDDNHTAGPCSGQEMHHGHEDGDIKAACFSVLHCPLGLCELQAYPFPDVVFQPLFSVCLAFFLLSLCLAGWFWPDLTNGTHVHTA